MLITVSTIYPEAGVNFPVSWKFSKLLREEMSEITSELSHSFQHTHGKDYSLGIILSTRANVLDLDIKGPSISKKYKCVDYVLYVPFSIVDPPKEFFIRYLDCVCTGVSTILSKYSEKLIIQEKIAKFKALALDLREEFSQFN